MLLYFENNKGELKSLGEFKTKEEINKKINDILFEKKFKSYYQVLTFISDKEIRIDYGSHSELFYVKTENEKEMPLKNIFVS